MIVIIAGLPGSGKSYFAEKLASRLNAAYINSDKLRIQLHASGKYSLMDKLVVYKEMAGQAKKFIERERDVVVDATFYLQTMREVFLKLARDNAIAIYVIEVVASEDLIIRRLKKPRKFSEADFGVYEKIRDSAEQITIPHLTIESTNENLEDMLNTALDYIKNG